VLDDHDAPADEIKEKVEAYRKAIAEAKDKLQAARTDLKSAVDARQEAVLITMGLLE
jgi:hypothetical protein